MFPAGARFRFGSHLATRINSMALASRRMAQHWLSCLDPTLSRIHFGSPKALSCRAFLSPYSFRFFLHPFRGPFQHSLTLLIRYRSDIQYLGLEVDTPIFPPPIRRTVLFLDHSTLLRIRGCHPLGRLFPEDFCSKNGYSPPHLPCIAAGNSARPVRLSVTLTNRIPIGFSSTRY